MAAMVNKFIWNLGICSCYIVDCDRWQTLLLLGLWVQISILKSDCTVGFSKRNSKNLCHLCHTVEGICRNILSFWHGWYWGTQMSQALSSTFFADGARDEVGHNGCWATPVDIAVWLALRLSHQRSWGRNWFPWSGWLTFCVMNWPDRTNAKVPYLSPNRCRRRKESIKKCDVDLQSPPPKQPVPKIMLRCRLTTRRIGKMQYREASSLRDLVLCPVSYCDGFLRT